MATAAGQTDRTFADTCIDETRRDSKWLTAPICSTFFLVRGNSLWRRETRHGAMLLMSALYKADTGAREKISSAVLAGPPSQLLEEKGETDKDWDILRCLHFSNRKTSRFSLMRNTSSLPLENNIRNGNPRSVLVCQCGLNQLGQIKIFLQTKSIRPHRKRSLIRSLYSKKRWANHVVTSVKR